MGAAFSASGRFVALTTFPFANAYIIDRSTGATRLLNRQFVAGPSQTSTNFAISVSADGRRVLFSSYAADLVPGDTNNRTDIFLRTLPPW